jgi:hypothetical protein
MMEFFQKTEVQVAFLVALFGVIGFAFRCYFLDRQTGRNLSQTMSSETDARNNQTIDLEKIGEIRFDYLPISPLDQDWQLEYGGKSKMPVFSLAVNAPIPGSLSIVSMQAYAIEYKIGESLGELCDRLKLAIKFKGEDDTMFWTEIELSTKDNSKWTKQWIKHYKGNKPSERNSPPYQDEWTRWMQGSELGNSWTIFDISLTEAVQETWGNEGWIFRSLTKIALRGNISVSPIEFYQSCRKPATVEKPSM